MGDSNRQLEGSQMLKQRLENNAEQHCITRRYLKYELTRKPLRVGLSLLVASFTLMLREIVPSKGLWKGAWVDGG